MSVTKSIIEDFELETGTQVYVQASGSRQTLTLSFDGRESNFAITLTPSEANELASKLLTVIEEAKQ